MLKFNFLKIFADFQKFSMKNFHFRMFYFVFTFDLFDYQLTIHKYLDIFFHSKVLFNFFKSEYYGFPLSLVVCGTTQIYTVSNYNICNIQSENLFYRRYFFR